MIGRPSLPPPPAGLALALASAVTACTGGETPTDDDATPPDDDATVADDDTAPPDDDSAPQDDDTAPPDDDSTPADDDTTASETPPFTAPEDLAGRFGAYHWEPDISGWPGSPDVLSWGAAEAADLGTRTLRLTLSARDDYYGANDGFTRLVEVARTPAWTAVFADDRVSTFLLTTYTEADIASEWAYGYSPEQAEAESAEIAELGAWLLGEYPGRTFVVLNWEGDNALSPHGDGAEVWEDYAEWIEARVKGVEAARAAVPGSTARLYSGLEFNAVYDLVTGQPCGTVPRDCVLSAVAPSARVDVYSYSAWQSLGPDTADDQVAARLSADLDRVLGHLQAGRPEVRRDEVIVGELGAARDAWNECRAATRVRGATTALLGWGAGLGVYWQMRDNKGTDDWYGLGLRTREGRLSLSGEWVAALWATGATDPPEGACGRINAGGIADGVTWDLDIVPGDVISIFGQDFAPSGNTVRFDQDGLLSEATAGSPWWYESWGQINVTLPPEVVPGEGIRVWIAGPDGLESNVERIVVLE